MCQYHRGHIADTIRENTAVQVSSAQYISFIIDGDTDLSVKECVIVYVYVRVLLDGHANADSEDVFRFYLYCFINT